MMIMYRRACVCSPFSQMIWHACTKHGRRITIYCLLCRSFRVFNPIVSTYTRIILYMPTGFFPLFPRRRHRAYTLRRCTSIKVFTHTRTKHCILLDVALFCFFFFWCDKHNNNTIIYLYTSARARSLNANLHRGAAATKHIIQAYLIIMYTTNTYTILFNKSVWGRSIE